jgi:hypothetical protein
MKKILYVVLIAFALSSVSEASARSRFAHSKNGKTVLVSHKKKKHKKHRNHHKKHKGHRSGARRANV